MEQVLNQLPKGWINVQVKDVTKSLSSGFACNKSFETTDGYVHLRTHNISTSGCLNFDQIIKVSHEKIDEKKSKIFKGEILFNNTNSKELVGKTAYVDQDYDFAFSNHLTRVVPNDKVHSKFLVYWLVSLQTSGYFNQICKKWIGQAGVNNTVLKGLSVPLPSKEEQKRIVEKLDALLTRIDTAIEHLQESVILADALYASALDKQFSKLMKESDILPFKKLVDNQDGRRIPIKAGERKNTHGTYPYYGATGVIDYVDDFIFEGERLLISEDGANLVARKYPIAFIADGKYWVNNHAHVVNALPEQTSNLYLKKFFAWVDLSSYITGSAQPKLSQGKLNTIPVPVPPLSEQTEIVAELDKAYQLTENLKKEIGEKLGILTSLKASILDSAFKGEL
ncbi:MAG: restriction endonuclease subunit S [Saccharospirillum sp.]